MQTVAAWSSTARTITCLMTDRTQLAFFIGGAQITFWDICVSSMRRADTEGLERCHVKHVWCAWCVYAVWMLWVVWRGTGRGGSSVRQTNRCLLCVWEWCGVVVCVFFDFLEKSTRTDLGRRVWESAREGCRTTKSQPNSLRTRHTANVGNLCRQAFCWEIPGTCLALETGVLLTLGRGVLFLFEVIFSSC